MPDTATQELDALLGTTSVVDPSLDATSEAQSFGEAATADLDNFLQSSSSFDNATQELDSFIGEDTEFTPLTNQSTSTRSTQSSQLGNPLEFAREYLGASQTEEVDFDKINKAYLKSYKSTIKKQGFSVAEQAAMIDNLNDRFDNVSSIEELEAIYDPQPAAEAAIDEPVAEDDFAPTFAGDVQRQASNLGRAVAGSAVDVVGKVVENFSTITGNLGAKKGDFRLFGTNPLTGEFKLFQAYSPEDIQKIIEQNGDASFDLLGDIGDQLQDLGADISEEADPNSIATKTGQVAGQLLAFVGFGATNKVAGLSAAVLSGGEFQLDDYEQTLLEKGQTFNQEEAASVAWLGNAIGSLESLPAFQLIGRAAGKKTVPNVVKWLDDNSGGVLTRVIKKAVPGAVEEGLQEATSQALSNLVASDVVKYDTERDWYEGTVESGEVGAAAGGVLNGLLGLLSGRRGSGVQNGPTNNETTINDGDINPSTEARRSQADDQRTIGPSDEVQPTDAGTQDVGERGTPREGNAVDGLPNNVSERGVDDPFGSSSVEQELDDVQRRLQSDNRPDESVLEGTGTDPTGTIEGDETQTAEAQAAATETTTGVNQNVESENVQRGQENGNRQNDNAENDANAVQRDGELNDGQQSVNNDTDARNQEDVLGEPFVPEQLDTVEQLSESDLAQLGRDFSEDTRFSVAQQDAETSTIDRARIDEVAQEYNSNIAANVNSRVNVVNSFDDLPQAVKDTVGTLQQGDVIKGAYHDGQAYVVADQTNSEADLQETIYHELYGHAGFRNFYGNEVAAELDSLTELIDNQEGGIEEYTTKLGINLDAYFDENSTLSPKNQERVITEELLANIVENEQNNPTLRRRAQNLLSRIVETLRRFNLSSVADRIETVGARTSTIIRNARRNIQQGATVQPQQRNTDFDDLNDSDDIRLSKTVDIQRQQGVKKPAAQNRREVNLRVPNRFDRFRKSWFVSGGNLREDIAKDINKTNWKNNLDAKRAENSLRDLKYNTRKFYKDKKVTKLQRQSDNEVLTEYLATSDPVRQQQLVEGNPILRDPDIKQSVDEINEDRNRAVAVAGDVTLRTLFNRARRLVDIDEIRVYQSYLVSSREGATFDFDSFYDAEQKIANGQEVTAEERAKAAFLTERNKPVFNAMHLHHTITQSVGSYFNRSYAIHDRGTRWTWDRIPQRVKKAAQDEMIENTRVPLITSENYAAQRAELRRTRTNEGISQANLSRFDETTNRNVEKLKQHKIEQDRHFKAAKRLGGWRQYIATGINEDVLRPYVRAAGLTRKTIEGETRTPLDAKASAQLLVNEQIEAGRNGDFATFLSPSADSKVDQSILKKKGDISPAIRELFGEHKDINVVYPRTVGKISEMAQSYWTQETVHRWLTNDNDGLLISNDPTDNWIPIPEESGFEFLGGKFVPPWVHDTLIVQGLLSGKPQDFWQKPFGRILVEQVPFIANVSRLAKLHLTATNLPTIARNIESGLIGILPASQLIITELITSPTVRGNITTARKTGFRNILEPLGLVNKTNKELNSLLEEYAEQGVTTQNTTIRTLKELEKAAENDAFVKLGENLKASDRFRDQVIGKPLKLNENLTKTFLNLFAAGDDTLRILGYEQLKLDARKRFELEGTPADQINEQQVRDWATERLNASYQTFDQAWRVAKELNKLPVFGNFVSFQSELARTTYNNAKIGIQDFRAGQQAIADGNAELGRHIRTQGLKRITSTGFAFAGYEYALYYGLTGITAAFQDDEDERPEGVPGREDVGSLMSSITAEYGKNSKFAAMNATVDEKGRPIVTVFNVSRMSMHGAYTQATRALLSDDNLTVGEAFTDALSESVGGAFDQDIGTKVILDLIEGEDDFGRPTRDSVGTLAKFLGRSGLTPRFYHNIYEAGTSIFNAATDRGPEDEAIADVVNLAGIRNQQNNIKYNVQNSIALDLEPLFKEEDSLRDFLLSPDELSREELESRFQDYFEQRESTYTKVGTKVSNAVKLTAYAFYESDNVDLKKNVLKKAKNYIAEEALDNFAIDRKDFSAGRFHKHNKRVPDFLIEGELPPLSSRKEFVSDDNFMFAVNNLKGTNFAIANPQKVSERKRWIKEIMRNETKRIKELNRASRQRQE